MPMLLTSQHKFTTVMSRECPLNTRCLRGTKKVRQRTSGNKTQITVLGCASAAGHVIPPMVVFAGKKFNHTLSEGEVPATLYGMSESWLDGSRILCHMVFNARCIKPTYCIAVGWSFVSFYTRTSANGSRA